MMKTISRGFTLVEMMIVVGIIAILAAFAIPSLIAYRQTAHARACGENMVTLRNALRNYMINHGGNYTLSQAALISENGNGILRTELHCPVGGEYQIEYNSTTQDFDISCTAANDDDHAVEADE